MIKLLLGKYFIWVVAFLAVMGYFLVRHRINAWIYGQPKGPSILDTLSTRDKVIAVFLIVWLIALVVLLVLAS